MSTVNKYEVRPMITYEVCGGGECRDKRAVCCLAVTAALRRFPNGGGRRRS